MSTPAEELQSLKLRAEIAKLEAEKADIERPFFHRPGFWLAIGPAIVAFGGLYLQFRAHQSELDKKQQEIRLAVREAALASSRAELAEARADWEVQKRNEELELKTQLLEDRNRRIRQLIETRFALFGMVCDAVGEIASAESWTESSAALDRLDDPEVVLIKTTGIATAIDKLRQRIAELSATEGSHPEDLHNEVLAVSFACREAWENERDVVLADVEEVTGDEIQREFKTHHYKQAMQVTQDLARASEWDAAVPERRMFWRLYLGKLVLVESQGQNSVSAAMVRFGKALRTWRQGTLSGDLRKTLSEHARATRRGMRIGHVRRTDVLAPLNDRHRRSTP